MAFTRPTLQTLVDRAVSDLKSSISGASTLLRNSVLRVLATVQAGANHLLYGYLDYQSKQLFILTADEIGLISHAAEYGIPRNVAQKSTGTATVTGTNGSVIPAGSLLQNASGIIFVVDTEVTLVGTSGTIALTAQTTGADGNEITGATISFVSPISGVDTNATVLTPGFDGGLDEEDVEDWRDRLLIRKRRPPHGGAEHDYIAWAMENAGVTRAWTFPQYMGVGTIGLAFVRDGDTNLIPSNAEMETVYDYIVQHTDSVTGKLVGIPVTALPGFFVIGYNDAQTFSEKEVDLTLGIYPNSAAIQAAITTKIDDCLEAFGGPGETVYLSDLYFILGGASGLQRLQIISPVADITATQQEVHVRGSITYQDYA